MFTHYCMILTSCLIMKLNYVTIIVIGKFVIEILFMFRASTPSLVGEKETKLLIKNFVELELVPILMIIKKKSSSILLLQETFY